MDYQVSKLQNGTAHTEKCLSSKRRKSLELYTPVKKRQGEDKSCQERLSRTANVNIKMNREVNLGSVMALQLVELLQYFRNHKVTELSSSLYTLVQLPGYTDNYKRHIMSKYKFLLFW